MKRIALIGITIAVILVVLISASWAEGLSDMSKQLKALEPNTDYKITDILGKKLTVSDPAGAKTTFQGVDTKGLKVGDILKGSALQEKLGGLGKGSLPSMPKGF
jgi:hypothetical protein